MPGNEGWEMVAARVLVAPKNKSIRRTRDRDLRDAEDAAANGLENGEIESIFERIGTDPAYGGDDRIRSASE